MRRQEAQSTRKTSLGSLDPIEKAVVAKFRANLSDHIADSTKHITWGIPLPYGAKLWHFDSSLVSTDGTAPEPGAVATLRPGEGRFGGAVAVEEETTNLLTPNQRSAETDTSGWATAIPNLSWAVASWGRTTAESYHGYASIYATTSGTRALEGVGQYVGTIVGGAGKTFTLSVYVKAPVGTKMALRLLDDNAGGASTRFTATGQWQRVSVTKAAHATIDPAWRWSICVDEPVAVTFYVDAVQLEAKPFATSFVDGSREDGILAYPVNPPDEHSIVCWRKSPTDTEYRHIVKHSDGTVFVDGEEDSDYDVGWIAGRNLVLDSATEHTFTNTIFNKPLRADVFHKMIGEQLTLSFYAKAEIAGQRMDCYLRDVSAQAIASGHWGPIEISTEYTRYSYTIVLGDISDVNNLSFAFRNTAVAGGSVRGAVSVKNIKIEKGSTATDWTPAPEDLGYSDDCLMFSNQTGLIDELLVAPFAATPEQIQAWYAMGVPFWDPWVGQR